MKQLQLIFDETIAKKQEAKDLRAMYKDALADADKYVELNEQIKTLREQKKEVELNIQSQLGRAWDKLEDIKTEIDADKIRMTDQALNDLMSGTTVSVKDQFENEYEPVWNVRFVKIK